MFSKINVTKIVLDHLNTLRDNQTQRLYFGDVTIFFLVPVIISLLMIISDNLLKESIVNILITSLSIFAALLFNLLLLIYDIIKKPEKETPKARQKKKLLEEIFANISYSILISIIGVLLSLLIFFDIRIQLFLDLVNFLVYFLVIQFLLTLFMVLKRVHILLAKEFQSSLPME